MTARSRSCSWIDRLLVASTSLLLLLGPGALDAWAAGVVLNWKQAVNGNAGIASNWQPAQIPGIDDTPTFNVPGTYTVTFDGTVPSTAFHVHRSGTVTRGPAREPDHDRCAGDRAPHPVVRRMLRHLAAGRLRADVACGIARGSQAVRRFWSRSWEMVRRRPRAGAHPLAATGSRLRPAWWRVLWARDRSHQELRIRALGEGSFIEVTLLR